MTPLELAVEKSGHDIAYFARRLCEKREPKALKNAEAVLRRHLRYGGASVGRAYRIAHLLGAVESPLHDLLLKPRPCWPAWALEDQSPQTTQTALDARTRNAHDDRRGAKTEPDAKPKPARVRRNQMVILELI